jgi:hypothetical protein
LFPSIKTSHSATLLRQHAQRFITNLAHLM